MKIDAASQIARWRENPAAFVNELFGVEPDAWQLKVLQAFPSQDSDKKRISMQACVGPGKSAVLAWCGWNFLMCYADRGEHPKGAAVSITGDNLRDGLWAEMAKWQNHSELLKREFTLTSTRIFANHHPETWFLSARSWSKTADSEEQGRTLSGLHSKFILAILDESGEIPLPVLKAAEQALSNCTWGKIMQAGNPSSQSGILYAAANTQRHLWHVIRITGDPDDPERSPRIDMNWAKQQIEMYGRDNPWVMSAILGQFPSTSANALLGVEEVEAAMRRHLRDDQYTYAQKRIGIDVARGGDDRSVLFPRQGLAAFKPVVMRTQFGPDIAARTMEAMKRWGHEVTMVDDTGGWGGSVIDSMIQAGMNPYPVNFAGKALDPRFLNKRAEMWFEMAQWVKRGGSLPNIPELVAELTTPEYTFHNGKFQIEPKENVKKRLGRSPDLAYALALTFALPDMPTQRTLTHAQHSVGKTLHDWDPFEEKRW